MKSFTEENIATLKEEWQREEREAKMEGWDFSHIEGRFYEDTNLPFNYKNEILAHLSDDMMLLDIDTGGGEFLLSLGHPVRNTAASENYAPNVDFCKRKLLPLGVDFRAGAADALPFADESFDIIINRHGDIYPKELYRLLKPGGYFITEQVGSDNDRELIELIMGKDTPVYYPDHYAFSLADKLEEVGFTVTRSAETYRTIRFFDTGALVWFARIIEWEFRGFSVEKNLDSLLTAQRLIEEGGYVGGKTHRFLISAKKPTKN